MANTKSAQKAIRSQARRTAQNQARKEAFRAARKQVTKVISGKTKGDVTAEISNFYKQVDKAAKTGAISKNAASRYKSRLVTKANKAAK